MTKCPPVRMPRSHMRSVPSARTEERECRAILFRIAVTDLPRVRQLRSHMMPENLFTDSSDDSGLKADTRKVKPRCYASASFVLYIVSARNSPHCSSIAPAVLGRLLRPYL